MIQDVIQSITMAQENTQDFRVTGLSKKELDKFDVLARKFGVSRNGLVRLLMLATVDGQITLESPTNPAHGVVKPKDS